MMWVGIFKFLVVPAVIAVVLLLIWLMVLSIRRSRQIAAGPGPEGFGGWLALLALGVTLGPVLNVVVLAPLLRAPQDIGTEFAVGLLLVLLAMQIFTAVAMWRRRSYFPKVFAIQSVLVVIINLLSLLGSYVSGEEVSSQVGSTIGSIVAPIVWTIYVFRSRRVKNTFRRGGAEDPKKTVEVF